MASQKQWNIYIICQCEYVTLKCQLSLCDNFVAYTKHVRQETYSSLSVWDQCSSSFRNPQSVGPVGPGIDTRMLSVNEKTRPFIGSLFMIGLTYSSSRSGRSWSDLPLIRQGLVGSLQSGERRERNDGVYYINSRNTDCRKSYCTGTTTENIM